MENYEMGDLQIILKDDSSKITMSWLGKSSDRDPSSSLNPYLNKIINDLKGKDLLIEFKALEYMNSSTVPPIVKFVKDLDDSGISAEIVYNKDSKWQTASFKALETIAMTLKKISVVGR